jgi:hypothetical protein
LGMEPTEKIRACANATRPTLTLVLQVDLFQRMYAQAVVFCNSYARRCIKARNLPAAAALLRKSEDMTGPSVADYPGISSSLHTPTKTIKPTAY